MNFNVKITLLQQSTNKTRAFANVTAFESIALTGITVMEGPSGMFVSMPSRKGTDEQWHDIFFPVTKEAREELSKAVLDAYYAAVNQSAAQQPTQQPQYQQPQYQQPTQQPQYQTFPDSGLPFN